MENETKMKKNIYTEYGTEKTKTEFKNWEEVKKAGWEFVCVSPRGVFMTRRGYINEFWECEK